MKKLITNNNKGLTIVEMLVSLSILAVVFLVTSSQLVTFNNILNDSERKQEAIGIAKQIENLVNVARNCTTSLAGAQLTPGTPTVVANLHYAVEDPNNLGQYIPADEPAFTPNQVFGKTKLDGMTVNPIERISNGPRRYLAEVHYNLSDDVDKEAYHFPPVTVLLTTNPTDEVAYCTTIEGGGEALKEKLCEISGSGMQIYNPVTGECKPRIEGTWYNNSNNLSATCPAGFKITSTTSDSCGAVPPAGFSDPFESPPRNYNDGYAYAEPPSYVRGLVAGDGCSCVYASDLGDTTNFTCQVECYDPNEPGVLDF